MLISPGNWFVQFQPVPGGINDLPGPGHPRHYYARIITFDQQGDELRVWLPGNPPIEMGRLKEQIEGQLYVSSVLYISPDDQADLKRRQEWTDFSWS